ncbi:DUF6233 domain-containing protein [Streptomyces sp. NPDC046900]
MAAIVVVIVVLVSSASRTSPEEGPVPDWVGVATTRPIGDHEARVVLTDPNFGPCAFCRPETELGSRTEPEGEISPSRSVYGPDPRECLLQGCRSHPK